MMRPQSHKNIIWQPNIISNHIFLSNFFENNAIQFKFFLELFDKFIDSKKGAFGFWNYYLKTNYSHHTLLQPPDMLAHFFFFFFKLFYIVRYKKDSLLFQLSSRTLVCKIASINIVLLARAHSA